MGRILYNKCVYIVLVDLTNVKNATFTVRYLDFVVLTYLNVDSHLFLHLSTGTLNWGFFLVYLSFGYSIHPCRFVRLNEENFSLLKVQDNHAVNWRG
jgi:hypothetical protein